MPEHLITHDERFLYLTLTNCAVERLHTGMLWTEGPVWFADGGFLLWSDIPNNRIMQWAEGLGVRVFRSPCSNTNGQG